MWVLTHQGIAITTNGAIGDGQHRLHGIVQCGSAQPFWVFFGQHPENFANYDLMKKRTAGDIFGIQRVPQAGKAAAITRQVNIYHARGYRGTSSGFASARTPEEMFNYYLEIGGGEIEAALTIHHRLTSNKVSQQSVICGLYIVARSLDLGLAELFFNNTATGVNLGPRAIEKKLRDHLLIHGRDMTPSKVAADVIRAWNAKRAKKRTFSVSPVDAVPEMI